jgi:DNA-binding beta-propeller fold protein YncE
MTPLSSEEYAVLKNWVANGAPSATGQVKFSDNPNRKKFYVCMQGCNQVAVFDAATRLIMRYVAVGNGFGGPHQVKLTPDGRYWAVVFIGGNVVQFYNTSDDRLAAQVSIPSRQWNTIAFTPDSKKAFVTALDVNVINVVPIDLTTMQAGSGYGLKTPHGSYVTHDGNTLYVTNQIGNYIYKVDISGGGFSESKLILNNDLLPSDASSLDPHEIAFSPDESKYFVSCQKSNEVRVFQTSNDSLLAVLSVGTKPQEFSVSQNFPYMFVSCTEDSLTDGISKGSIYLINYLTNQKLTFPSTGTEKFYDQLFQPHGIAVDDDHNVLMIASLNADPTGPAPHHTSACGGRSGFMTAIDLNTLDGIVNTTSDGSAYIFKTEVLNAPYFVAYRK